ncbi:MAG: hypothetical protein Ta2D_11350 [Rickettsiales bacterium]|nr:MAG: hypothetical protein Ta2D_11350 [Rickettsiales bacterium]
MLRKLALSFYLTGTSIRGIQKALNTSFNIKLPFCVINNWLLNANRILDSEKQQREKEEIKNVSHISILEMDKLFTYIKKTKKQTNQ